MFGGRELVWQGQRQLWTVGYRTEALSASKKCTAYGQDGSIACWMKVSMLLIGKADRRRLREDPEYQRRQTEPITKPKLRSKQIMYSGGNNYLIPQWFCKLAHWQRNEWSITVNSLTVRDRISKRKSRKSHKKKRIDLHLMHMQYFIGVIKRAPSFTDVKLGSRHLLRLNNDCGYMVGPEWLMD